MSSNCCFFLFLLLTLIETLAQTTLTDSEGICTVCSVRCPGYAERTSASVFDFSGL